VSLATAQTIVGAFEIYCGAGLVFALLFVAGPVTRMDHAVANAPLTMRALIVPGVTALWPLFAWRWARGFPPVLERTAHRTGAAASVVKPLRKAAFGGSR
jgi:hypothetical protein